jgi:murein DD-endopeptidase MepM/ murein hydrolase activator NlpD
VFKNFFLWLGFRSSWNYQRNPSRLLINIALVALALYAGVAHYVSRSSPDVLTETRVTIPAPPAPTLIERFEGQIQKNMTLSDVLTNYNLSQEMIHQLVAVAKPIYNLRRLIPGNWFELEKLPDGTLKTFSYAVDLDQYLEVSLTDGGYRAAMKPFEYEVRRELISGTIRSSLFETMRDLKEGDQLAFDMAETFSYDIDFNTELQAGDRFKLAVEKHFRDGSFVKYGKIAAAEFSNKGKVYSAFHFIDPEGRSDYYDARGRSLRRDLLKSPIKFSRVASTFTRRRFHPVLGVFRPHLGIDYAAAVGTPVHAAGNGRVQFAGWRNGFGKFIQINHGTEYTTTYGHLSRIAAGLRNGSEVRQGQVIGYVGATGLATGPHLDYRIMRRGIFVNPLSVKFQPSVPLKREYLMAFEAKKQKWLAQLARLELSKEPRQVVSLGNPAPHTPLNPTGLGQ